MLLGAAVGALLLAALTLGGTYERIAQETAWGQRMLPAHAGGSRAGVWHMALLLLLCAGLTLTAAQLMLAGAQALRVALPFAGRGALAGVLALCAGLLTALVYAGLDLAVRLMPLLILPAAAAGLTCLRRGGPA